MSEILNNDWLATPCHCPAKVPIHTSKPSTKVTNSCSHLSQTGIFNSLLKTPTTTLKHCILVSYLYISLTHYNMNFLALETVS